MKVRFKETAFVWSPKINDVVPVVRDYVSDRPLQTEFDSVADATAFAKRVIGSGAFAVSEEEINAPITAPG